jgi:hypothetical protein
MASKGSWSSGKVKTVDNAKKLGIIEETGGNNVMFALDDVLLPEGVEDISKAVQGKTVLFKKEDTKFGSEAKKVTLIDDSVKK